MKIVRHLEGSHLVLALTGQLDATWSSAVDDAVAAAIREGRHHVFLDLAGVDYISSAGLRVLISHFKTLKAIHGVFALRNGRPSVLKVIELSGLNSLLAAAEVAGLSSAAPAMTEFTTAAANWERVGALSPVALRAVGGASPFDRAAGAAVDFSPARLGIGVGAIAADATEAAPRLGEFLAVAGCAAHLPAGESKRADFIESEKDFVPSAWLSSGLVAEGEPTLQLRFESADRVTLDEILRVVLAEAGSPAMFVMIAETAGLVGSSLRRSPAVESGDPFAFPAIRDWLNFTSERAHRDAVALVVGLAAEPGSVWDPQTRSHGRAADLRAHAHAAVFPYRPIRKGAIDLGESVRGLFEAGGLQAVMHLLNDARDVEGAGDSEFFRGAVWVANVR